MRPTTAVVPAQAGTHNHSRLEQVRQVIPTRIIFFDPPNLPFALPILQLLLARNRFERRCKRLNVNKSMHFVLLDEFRGSSSAMQFQPSRQIIRDADVKRPMQAAGEDVDVISTRFAHRLHQLACH